MTLLTHYAPPVQIHMDIFRYQAGRPPIFNSSFLTRDSESESLVRKLPKIKWIWLNQMPNLDFTFADYNQPGLGWRRKDAVF